MADESLKPNAEHWSVARRLVEGIEIEPTQRERLIGDIADALAVAEAKRPKEA